MRPCAGSSPSSCSRPALEPPHSRARTHRPPTPSRPHRPARARLDARALVQLRAARAPGPARQRRAGALVHGSELPVVQCHRTGPEPFRPGVLRPRPGRDRRVPPQGPGAARSRDRARLRRAYQFRFPVAVDPDWQTLKRWWLDDHERTWTSVSFLIDQRGVIRHVHLGGKLAPDTDDFRIMRAKIQELLAEDP